MQHQLKSLLALNYAPGVGPKTCAKLIKHFGSSDAVFNAKPAVWNQLGLSAITQNYLRKPNWAQADIELEWAGRSNHHLIPYDNEQYPELLKEISDAPCLLYVKGNPECLSDLQLAIVGSRNPTAGGRQTAFDFARYLARSGLTITSGLAIGIDEAAHQGALTVKSATVAVLGTGMDQIYPTKNQPLADQIAESGALVSEFPLGTKALPHNFPRRNRIVSGLSLGCLVVEAAVRSGSLITARHALDQGREVFAIPGSIHNPLSRGCHRLIRDGAKLVETAQDIIVELGVLMQAALYPANRQSSDKKTITVPSGQFKKTNYSLDLDHGYELDNGYKVLLDMIAFDPVTPDSLIQKSGFTAQKVSSMLLMLELKGYITANPGGTYVKSTH